MNKGNVLLIHLQLLISPTGHWFGLVDIETTELTILMKGLKGLFIKIIICFTKLLRKGSSFKIRQRNLRILVSEMLKVKFRVVAKIMKEIFEIDNLNYNAWHDFLIKRHNAWSRTINIDSPWFDRCITERIQHHLFA